MNASHFVVLAVALMAGNAHATCMYPAEPAKLPDGKTATREEMMAGQKAVKDFDASIVSYTSCLKDEHEAALTRNTSLSEDQKKEMERVLTQKYDAAISADEALAARFNEQVKIYKAKDAPK